jgi:predicted permease
MTPPRLAVWLLGTILGRDAREAIEGDLREDFARLARVRGAPWARRWFWRQALASVGWRAVAAAGSHRREAEPPTPQRRAASMSGLMQDMRFGLRVLRKAPGFTATAVLTLGIGIAGATTIVTAAGWAWLRPLPFESPERLVHVGEADDDGISIGNVGYETVLDWQQRVSSFETVLPIRGWTPTLVDQAGAQRLNALRVGWQYFRMLGIRPALGRDFVAADDTPETWQVIILSDRLWRSGFGARPDIVGERVTFNDREYEIVGVLPATFEPLISQRFYTEADIWAPLGYAAGGSSACRTCRHLRAVGRLAPGATTDAAMSELAGVQAQLRAEHPTGYGGAAPLIRSLGDSLSQAYRRPLQVLMGAVAFLMLIACVNVAGLLIARATERQREMSVRVALGAGRLRIVRQLLTESLMLAALATGLGVGLGRLGLVLLAERAPVGLPRLDRALADPSVWLVAAAVGAAALVIFGLLPAFETARTDVQSMLRAQRQSAGRRTVRLREAMIVGQVGVALVLVIGGGLMYRTVERLLAVDPGFNPHGVLTAQFSLVGQRWAEDSAVYAFQEELLARARSWPGVEAAGLTGLLPLGGSYDRRGFTIEGQAYETPDDAPNAERYSVTPGYFAALQITATRGRLITDSDTATSERVALVSEASVRRYWPDRDPIDTRFRLGASDAAPWIRVVGVVGDVRQYALETPPIPQFYLPQSQVTDSFLVLVVRAPGQLDPVAAQIRTEVAALAPDVPVYGVARFDEVLTASVGTRRFLMLVLGLFAVVSVLLASVGLYGVISQMVAGREREMSIRVSLGARRAEIARLLLGRGLTLVGMGLAAGVGAAALVSGMLQAQLFETAAVDPITYGAAAAVLSAVGLVAHALPLHRAVRVDPALTLRGE